MSCGYRFSPRGEYIEPAIQKIFVDVFPNKTSEAYVDTIFRSAFIEEFISGKRFTVVESRESSDAILRGSIENLTFSPLSPKKTKIAAEERITVTIDLSLEERTSGRTIWMNKSLTCYTDYPIEDTSTKERSRQLGLTKLARDTAEKAYNALMAGF